MIWRVKFDCWWLISAELCIKEYRLQNHDWSSLTCLSGKLRALQAHLKIYTTAPNLILSCSAVFMPVCQTDCMSGMCGHLQFYTTLPDQSGGWCWQVTGQGVACRNTLGSCVNHPARLSSEHPWGMLLLTDGLTLEPWNQQPRKQAGSGLHI